MLRAGTYLDAVITVRKVVHGLELFVDDTDAGFMGADFDVFDIFNGLAHLGQSCVYVLSRLNGSLRVKFG